MRYDETQYAASRATSPQAQAFPHNAPDDTSITVTAGGLAIAVVSDGHAVEWMHPDLADNQDLAKACYEFALAAAEIRDQTLELAAA